MSSAQAKGGNYKPNRIPSKEEVSAYFSERIAHYEELKRMCLSGKFNVYVTHKGHFIYRPKGGK